MASVDGSKSVHTASDEIFDNLCVPCHARGIVKEAKNYCLDCSEYLCEPCIDYHRKLTFTKNHKIVSTDKVPLDTSRRLTINCECKKSQEVGFYCENHDEVTCGPCQSFKHHKCRTYPIQQRGAGYTSQKIDSLLSRIKALKDKYDQLRLICSKDEKELTRSREDCKKEIQAVRKELGDFLDKLERKMLTELDQLKSKEQQRIAQQIETLSTALQILDADYQLLDDAKNDGRKHVMFAADTQISKRFQECENRLSELQKEAVKLSLTFEKNSTLYDLLSDKNIHLGSLKMSKQNRHTVLPRIVSHRKVNVRKSSDKNYSRITGCAVMPNGYVVICDYKNEKIKLLDTSLALKDSLDLPDPWDVSVVDDNNIIVTLVDKKQLQNVQIFPKLKKGSVLQLDKQCWGLTVSRGNIFVTFHNDPGEGEVRVLDKQGNIKRRLGVTETGSFLFSGPYYITVSTTGDKVYVSDSHNDTVTRMTADGSIYTYKDKDLKWPVALYCDDNDNIMVCTYGSDNVQMIDAGGNKAGTILTAKDELKNPLSIAFRKSDNSLVVGCYDNNNVFVYSLSDK